MKKIMTLALVVVSIKLSAQSIEKKLSHFDKIVVSPNINLVLRQGSSESVKINYANVDPSKINITVKNKTLRIYLDGQRFTEKRKRVNFDGEVKMEKVYRDAAITAYVTLDQLKKLVVRGEQEIDAEAPIENKKFKLSAYGECTITLASLQTGKFKASLYGQHVLKVKSGRADIQKYKLFGENKIDAQAIQSEEAFTTTFGESKIRIYAKESLKLVTVGESDVLVKGSPEVSKVTLGEVSVAKR